MFECFTCFGAGPSDPHLELRELQGRFEYARQKLAEFGLNNLDVRDRVSMDAFYRQATEGDCASKAGLLSGSSTKAVFRAWSDLKGMTRDHAIQSYLRNLESVLKEKHEELRALAPENLCVRNDARFGGAPAGRGAPAALPEAAGPEAGERPRASFGEWLQGLFGVETLQQRFDRSAEEFRRDPPYVFHVDLQERLQLYGLMQQGARGDCSEGKPGIFSDPHGVEKWSAWERERGVPQRTAQEAFVARLELAKAKALAKMAPEGQPAAPAPAPSPKKGKHRRTESASSVEGKKSKKEKSSSKVFWSPGRATPPPAEAPQPSA
eukprot:tig00000388_g24804.t1